MGLSLLKPEQLQATWGTLISLWLSGFKNAQHHAWLTEFYKAVAATTTVDLAHASSASPVH